MKKHIYVVCQVCRDNIATIPTGADIKMPLAYPLKGEMFTSFDPIHDPDNPPFPLGVIDWPNFFCPMGGKQHRPMTVDNEILTSRGILIVPKDGSPLYFKNAPLDRDKLFEEREEDHGKTEEQPRQEESVQPVKAEKESIAHTNLEQPEAGSMYRAGSKYKCPHCPNKSFKNSSGLVNHLRIKHKERVDARKF
jgi:hypothetical protein